MFVHKTSLIHTKFGSFVASDISENVSHIPAKLIKASTGQISVVPAHFNFHGEVELDFPVYGGTYDLPDLAKLAGLITSHGVIAQFIVLLYLEDRKKAEQVTDFIERTLTIYTGKKIVAVIEDEYIEITEIYNALKSFLSFDINQIPSYVLAGNLRTVLSYIGEFIDLFDEVDGQYVIKFNTEQFTHYFSLLLLRCGILNRVDYTEQTITLSHKAMSSLVMLCKDDILIENDNRLKITITDWTYRIGYEQFVYITEDMIPQFDVGNRVLAIDFIDKEVMYEAFGVSQQVG